MAVGLLLALASCVQNNGKMTTIYDFKALLQISHHTGAR